MSSATAVILGAARTPIGRLGGVLSEVPAPALGATAIRGALERSGVLPQQVDYAIMGNVLSAGVGMAPARQAAIGAGLPDTCPALTVNKVCASGMMAVVLAAQMIKAEDVRVAVAGGMESMSRAPHLLMGSRTGKRLGDWELTDAMVHDGLWCPFNDCHMGTLAGATGSAFETGREEQDRLALASHQRAVQAARDGGFRAEIAPVHVSKRGESSLVNSDEGPRPDTSLEALGKLPPAFPGTAVTAGNSSQISDGAAALLVASEGYCRTTGLRPLARIVDYVFVANSPARLFEAPALAIGSLLERTKRSLSEIDLLEVNEAFAAQVVANGRALNWDWDRVNVKGGAIALGHPIGASGARILVTLLSALKERGLQHGLAAVCHGGGGSVAMMVELL
ncbi:MAG: acetyl-CoA C-acyltransferase [Chloroflexi bacterium]|nr:acetyl-CoA C-acyltransferase [Chloroflexota bacterium]